MQKIFVFQRVRIEIEGQTVRVCRGGAQIYKLVAAGYAQDHYIDIRVLYAEQETAFERSKICDLQISMQHRQMILHRMKISRQSPGMCKQNPLKEQGPGMDLDLSLINN